MAEDVRTPVDPTPEPEPAIEAHHETHATTGGAAAAGALVAGAIGLTGGPIAAAVGAVGGAIVGAAAERMMHSEDDQLPSTIYRSETTDARVPNVDSRDREDDVKIE
jgi:outer membrane lipoprotein SlyB